MTPSNRFAAPLPIIHAVTIALACAFVSSPSVAASRAASAAFCSGQTIDSPPAAFSRGDRELCEGNFASAASDFSTLLAHYEADVGGGIDRPEFERRYVLAEELAGSDDPALKILEKRKADAETLSFFHGDVCSAMRAYVADDAKYVRTPDETEYYTSHGGASPEFEPAADAACAGDLQLAMRHMKLVKGDAASLHDLMLGALFARLRDWPRAAEAWWRASGEYPDLPAMEEIEISQFQFDAQWMLFYYRAHLR